MRSDIVCETHCCRNMHLFAIQANSQDGSWFTFIGRNDSIAGGRKYNAPVSQGDERQSFRLAASECMFLRGLSFQCFALSNAFTNVHNTCPPRSKSLKEPVRSYLPARWSQTHEDVWRRSPLSECPQGSSKAFNDEWYRSLDAWRQQGTSWCHGALLSREGLLIALENQRSCQILS